ncbi:hypothetical protein WDW86_21190 [Bdellovibrionota bacterium FG-2]
MRFRVFLTLLFLVGCKPGEFPLVPPTPGTPERVQALRAQMSRELPQCIEKLEQRFGKVWENTRGLSLDLTDNGSNINDRASASTLGNAGHIEISFRQQYFTSGSQAFSQTLCHEVVHAYCRNFSSPNNYSKIPTWFREGSAVYLAEQTHAKILRLLYANLETPWDQINGLESPRHGFGDYFEDALAFEFLDQKDGALTQVIARVLEGSDVFAAIQDSTGVTKTVFLAQAKEYAIRRVKQLASEIPEDLRKAALDTRTSGKRATALAELEAYLTSRDVRITSDGSITGQPTPPEFFALRLLANQYRFGHATSALAHPIYEFLLTQTPSYNYGGDAGNVRYEWANLLLGSGEPGRALEQFMRVYSEHLEEPMLQNASTLGIARAYFMLENWDQARRWLEPQNLADTSTAEEIGARLGISYFKICNPKGVKILNKLAATDSRHLWIAEARKALAQIQAGTLAAPGCKK